MISRPRFVALDAPPWWQRSPERPESLRGALNAADLWVRHKPVVESSTGPAGGACLTGGCSRVCGESRRALQRQSVVSTLRRVAGCSFRSWLDVGDGLRRGWTSLEGYSKRWRRAMGQRSSRCTSSTRRPWTTEPHPHSRCSLPRGPDIRPVLFPPIGPSRTPRARLPRPTGRSGRSE